MLSNIKVLCSRRALSLTKIAKKSLFHVSPAVSKVNFLQPKRPLSTSSEVKEDEPIVSAVEEPARLDHCGAMTDPSRLDEDIASFEEANRSVQVEDDTEWDAASNENVKRGIEEEAEAETFMLADNKNLEKEPLPSAEELMGIFADVSSPSPTTPPTYDTFKRLIYGFGRWKLVANMLSAFAKMKELNLQPKEDVYVIMFFQLLRHLNSRHIADMFFMTLNFNFQNVSNLSITPMSHAEKVKLAVNAGNALLSMMQAEKLQLPTIFYEYCLKKMMNFNYLNSMRNLISKMEQLGVQPSNRCYYILLRAMSYEPSRNLDQMKALFLSRRSLGKVGEEEEGLFVRSLIRARDFDGIKTYMTPKLEAGGCPKLYKYVVRGFVENMMMNDAIAFLSHLTQYSHYVPEDEHFSPVLQECCLQGNFSAFKKVAEIMEQVGMQKRACYYSFLIWIKCKENPSEIPKISESYKNDNIKMDTYMFSNCLNILCDSSFTFEIHTLVLTHFFKEDIEYVPDADDRLASFYPFFSRSCQILYAQAKETGVHISKAHTILLMKLLLKDGQMEAADRFYREVMHYNYHRLILHGLLRGFISKKDVQGVQKYMAFIGKKLFLKRLPLSLMNQLRSFYEATPELNQSPRSRRDFNGIVSYFERASGLPPQHSEVEPVQGGSPPLPSSRGPMEYDNSGRYRADGHQGNYPQEGSNQGHYRSQGMDNPPPMSSTRRYAGDRERINMSRDNRSHVSSHGSYAPADPYGPNAHGHGPRPGNNMSPAYDGRNNIRYERSYAQYPSDNPDYDSAPPRRQSNPNMMMRSRERREAAYSYDGDSIRSSWNSGDRSDHNAAVGRYQRSSVFADNAAGQSSSTASSSLAVPRMDMGQSVTSSKQTGSASKAAPGGIFSSQEY